MKRSPRNIPWYDSYTHLSVLISMSTNLPRELQDTLGDSLLITVKRYIYILRDFGGFRQLEASFMWHYYLSLKQGDRWRNASPRLHKAFHLITILPDPILRHINRECEGLVDHLSVQMLTSRVDMRASRLHIHQVCELSHRLLMEIPHCSEESEPVVETIDITDIIGEDRLLSFKAG
jgi:hypothetical protein